MSSINTVALSGFLGKDADTRLTQGGLYIASFSLAVGEYRKNGDDYTSWIRCSAFGRYAEAIAPYLTRGKHVTVRGTLHQSSWKDDRGEWQSKVEVHVRELDLGPSSQREQPEAPSPAVAEISEVAANGVVPELTASDAAPALAAVRSAYPQAQLYGDDDDVPF